MSDKQRSDRRRLENRRKIALIQMTSRLDREPNLVWVEDKIREAAQSGAGYVLTPENTTFMDLDRSRQYEKAEPSQGSEAVALFSGLAKELNLVLHIGSMATRQDPSAKNETDDDQSRLVNRSYLFGPNGDLIAHYDKIHMFDVDLPNGESYRESAQFEAGTTGIVADLNGLKLGLSICYDLRFPGLYRDLAQKGAQLIAVPAAFTQQTGEAHWHILLRARAIETGCFIIAAAQTGQHETGRATYGHSLIISPWGKIIADSGTEPGVTVAEIDLTEIEQARQAVPSLQGDRNYEVKFVK